MVCVNAGFCLQFSWCAISHYNGLVAQALGPAIDLTGNRQGGVT